MISHYYNLLVKAMFRNRFSDAQCGFKAPKRAAAEELLPEVEDDEWFFDTELLLAAERRGYRISEVPVDWIEDLDSRVNVASTALKDVKGLLRVREERLRRWLHERRKGIGRTKRVGKQVHKLSQVRPAVGFTPGSAKTGPARCTSASFHPR